MAISPLPDVPSRQDPSTFSAKTDAFLSALPTFVTEANALQTDVNSKQSAATTAANTATTQAGIATTKAAEAASSAAAALVSEQNALVLVGPSLGVKASDPALNNQGGILVTGNWYFNSSTGYLRVYNGTTWVQGISAVAGVSTVNGQSGAVTIDLSGQNLSLFNSGII